MTTMLNSLAGRNYKTSVFEFSAETGDDPIIQIYKTAAGAWGYEFSQLPAEALDCREILVSKNICDEAIKRLIEATDRGTAGMLWVMTGPKMDDGLADNMIVTSDKFIRRSAVC